jgi:hypothetical protein
MGVFPGAGGHPLQAVPAGVPQPGAGPGRNGAAPAYLPLKAAIMQTHWMFPDVLVPVAL